jgi:hypothetical protein
MGGACSMYEGEESAYRVWWGKLRGRSHLEDLGKDGMIILKSMFKKWVWNWI